MFTKKSSKALEKLIDSPLIKLKKMILKTQKKQYLQTIDEIFIGDDSSVLDEAFNDLEMLLNSIEIQFEFGSDKKSLAILQKLSIELFQKTKGFNLLFQLAYFQFFDKFFHRKCISNRKITNFCSS